MDEGDQIKLIKTYSAEVMLDFLIEAMITLLDKDLIPEATFACIKVIIEGLELNFEQSLQNNVDKLLVRFPLEEGFTTERANNRNLEAERTELEK